jgi:hypothetical protein
MARPVRAAGRAGRAGSPAARWSAASRGPPRPAGGQAVHGQLEGRVAAEAFGVVGVPVASRDHQHAEAQDVGDLVPDPSRQTWIVDAGGQAVGDAEPSLDLAQRQDAGVGGELPAVEAGDDGSACHR